MRDIHDFHNGGHRESPGSSYMKTRSERPTIASRLSSFVMASTSNVSKSDISYGKRYTWRFSSQKKT